MILEMRQRLRVVWEITELVRTDDLIPYSKQKEDFGDSRRKASNTHKLTIRLVRNTCDCKNLMSQYSASRIPTPPIMHKSENNGSEPTNEIITVGLNPYEKAMYPFQIATEPGETAASIKLRNEAAKLLEIAKQRDLTLEINFESIHHNRLLASGNVRDVLNLSDGAIVEYPLKAEPQWHKAAAATQPEPTALPEVAEEMSEAELVEAA